MECQICEQNHSTRYKNNLKWHTYVHSHQSVLDGFDAFFLVLRVAVSLGRLVAAVFSSVTIFTKARLDDWLVETSPSSIHIGLLILRNCWRAVGRELVIDILTSSVKHRPETLEESSIGVLDSESSKNCDS
jgi:hypothetical protein